MNRLDKVQLFSLLLLSGVWTVLCTAELIGTGEMLGAMLEILFNALEDFDVDACDDIMKQIRSYSYDEDTQTQVEELAGAVTDLDTDMAEDIINKIRDNMWRKI